MRTRFYCLQLLFAILFLAACNSKPNQAKVTSSGRKISLALELDSGFISKEAGLKFMLEHKLSDTVGCNWKEYAATDTIGKYYRSAETGNYILSLKEKLKEYPAEDFLLIEINSAKDKILASEKYGHWSWPSCWESKKDLLLKVGKFFAFKACGTGSGFSSSNLYLFKHVMPQDSLNYIVSGEWHGPMEIYAGQNLTSKTEWKGNNLIMHYVYEELLAINPDSADSAVIHVNKKPFSIRYNWQNDNWFAPDSNLLKNSDYFF